MAKTKIEHECRQPKWWKTTKKNQKATKNRGKKRKAVAIDGILGQATDSGKLVDTFEKKMNDKWKKSVSQSEAWRQREREIEVQVRVGQL